MAASTKSQVAIVTGAAQGIGRAIALRLADDGLNVVVNDLPSKARELDALVKDINLRKQRGLAVVGDVSKELDVENLVDSAVKEFGGLDVMIANAGIARFGPLVTTSVDDWDFLQSVNIRGVFMCYKAAAIQMIKQGRGGRIIGASSLAGKAGLAKWSSYAASKFAVRGLTQSAAAELGQHGITVNAYAPGAVDTPLLVGVQEDSHKEGILRTSGSKVPIMAPEDIAGLVSYLIRDEAKFVTGQSVSINGGVYFD